MKALFTKKILIYLVIAASVIIPAAGQQRSKFSNPAFGYSLSKGFVNITELTGALGLGNTEPDNTKYFFGLTNTFGYQIDRHVMGGVGTGVLLYDAGIMIPFFVSNRFNLYLRHSTPFIYGEAGAVLNPEDLIDGSKIFVNPGLGISHNITEKFEAQLSAGLMIQARAMQNAASFVNIKLGIVYRKNTQRLFKR